MAAKQVYQFQARFTTKLEQRCEIAWRYIAVTLGDNTSRRSNHLPITHLLTGQAKRREL